MGDGRVRASPAWLAAGPSFRRGATIPSTGRTANHALHSRTLRLSRLGYQYEPDASRHLALLRRACWNGAADLRIARRLCTAQNPQAQTALALKSSFSRRIQVLRNCRVSCDRHLRPGLLRKWVACF